MALRSCKFAYIPVFKVVALNVNNVTWSCLRTVRIRSFSLNEDSITAQTVISNDHLTPEISLHLITPKCDLWHLKCTESKFKRDPFWAIYWPGGQALTRYILDNKHLFSGKCVIDVGSGCGASAIAAAKSNSKIVLANDIDPLSLSAIKLNAALNNVQIFFENEDIIGKDVDNLELFVDDILIKPRWDIILVGDMFYDCDFSKLLFSWLYEMNQRGKTILIGDPGRYGMKIILDLGKCIKIAEYEIKTDEHFGFCTSSVWQIQH